MMAVRSRRISCPSRLFVNLAGLVLGLLPLAARADEPVPAAPPAAVAPLGGSSNIDPESVVPGLLAAGRCEAALRTLFTMDPSQHHAHEMIWFCRAYHQCGDPKDALAACSVVTAQSDVFSPAERQEAQSYTALAMSQYQQSLSYPSVPAVVPAAPAPEPPAAPPAPLPPRPALAASVPAPPVWEGQSRFYFHARPLWSLITITGGLMVDVGFEHIFKSGLLLGGEISPAALVFPLFGIQGQARLGYGSRRFTIGVAGGAGVTSSIGYGSGPPSYQPRAGFFFRAGRLDRTYVEFALNLIFLKTGPTSPTIPIPFDGVIHISSKTSENWRFKMDLGGSYYLFGPYLLLGGERRLSSSESGNTALNFGVGLLFPIAAFGIPGPMLSIGYEKRF